MRDLQSSSKLACTIALSALLGLPYLWTQNTIAAPVLYNQLITLGAWGIFLMILFNALKPQKQVFQVVASALMLGSLQILLLFIQCILGKSTPYSGVILSAVCIYSGALLCLLAGGHLELERKANGEKILFASIGAWIVVAVGGTQVLFGWLQYLELNIHMPFISLLSVGGRVYGNMRQPNNFALLTILTIVATLWLADSSNRQSARLSSSLYALAVLSLAAVVLSSSRMGMVLVFAISAWGLFEIKHDKRRAFRLISMVTLYFLFRWIFTALDERNILAFWGTMRKMSLEASANADRFAYWNTALALIKDQPIFGVGYDRFAQLALIKGVAFSLSNHTENAHNLVLQWALDFGVPATAILLSLLVYVLFKCRSLVHDFTGRVMLFALLAPLAHQMLEYPLAYNFFLFPWAFLLGVAMLRAQSMYKPISGNISSSTALLQETPVVASGKQVHMWILAPVLIVVAACFSAHDFSRVAPLYERDALTPYAARVQQSYGTVLYTQHADYAAMGMWEPNPEIAENQFRVASKVSGFRFDENVASVMMQTAALTGRDCLAFALAQRVSSADPVVYKKIQARVQSSVFPELQALKDYMQKPYAVAWPSNEKAKCKSTLHNVAK